MITCEKPEHYKSQNGWIEYNDVDVCNVKPVIVILDPRRVYSQLRQFEPDLARVERAIKKIQSGHLELPDVRCDPSDEPFFNQGQHRTFALYILGFSSYPVVTTDIDAPTLLARFGATVADARLHFDWSGIPEYPVMGMEDRTARSASGISRTRA